MAERQWKHRKGEMVCFNLQSYQMAEQSADSGNGGERKDAQLSLTGCEGKAEKKTLKEQEESKRLGES